MWKHDISTVGELIEVLKNIPSDTPLAALSTDLYHVLRRGVSVYYGPIGSKYRTEEAKRKDEVPDGTLAVQIIHEATWS